MVKKTRGSKRSKSAELDGSLFGDYEEVPTNAGTEAFIKSRKTSKNIRRAIWATVLFFFPLSVLMNLVWGTQIIMNDEEPEQVTSDQQTPNRSVAMRAVQTWLDSDADPMPGTTLLSWDQVTTVSEPSTQTDPNTNEVTEVPGIEVHEMSLMDSSDRIYSASVQVSWSPIRGALVMGPPSVDPRTPADAQAFQDVFPWPGAEQINAPEPVQKAVRVWGDAFFSGDPENLKLTVGDGRADTSYMPMPSAQITTVNVTDATLPGGASLPEDPEATPPIQVVQAQLTLDWPGTSESSSANSRTFTYDLLVERADTAAPIVTAWGAPGTGTTLEQFDNAISGRVLTSNDTVKMQTPESSESASPEAETEPSDASSTEPTDEPIQEAESN